MGILVQQRKTPLGLWGHSPSRIREYLANEPGSYYYYPGSQSIVASNEPGVAQSTVSAASGSSAECGRLVWLANALIAVGWILATTVIAGITRAPIRDRYP